MTTTSLHLDMILNEMARRDGPVASLPEPLARQAAGCPGLAVQVRHVRKSYAGREVLSDIDLRVEPGEFVAIVGRSGCGKSTLLRLISGLEALDRGQIALDGRALADEQSSLRMMFQDPRLLPWKRVIDNVALGLGGLDARGRALEVLQQVGLDQRADEWPAVLSGGQRQRVALARALVHRPRLLLLDEPLGALDALTRIEMQALIESLWRQHGFTALMVTHDVSEAVALADRVVLIEDHRIVMDERIALERPRSRGHPGFAAAEAAILDRVMRLPSGAVPDAGAKALQVPTSRLRFAV